QPFLTRISPSKDYFHSAFLPRNLPRLHHRYTPLCGAPNRFDPQNLTSTHPVQKLMLLPGVDCFRNSPAKKCPYSVCQVKLRFMRHCSWVEACVAMYRALLFKPETITEFPTLYRPSLVLSRQKKAGLTFMETDLLSFRSAEGCRATRLRLANSSAPLK